MGPHFRAAATLGFTLVATRGYDSAPGLQGRRRYINIQRTEWGTTPHAGSGGVETPTVKVERSLLEHVASRALAASPTHDPSAYPHTCLSMRPRSFCWSCSLPTCLRANISRLCLPAGQARSAGSRWHAVATRAERGTRAACSLRGPLPPCGCRLARMRGKLYSWDDAPPLSFGRVGPAWGSGFAR